MRALVKSVLIVRGGNIVTDNSVGATEDEKQDDGLYLLNLSTFLLRLPDDAVLHCTGYKSCLISLEKWRKICGKF